MGNAIRPCILRVQGAGGCMYHILSSADGATPHFHPRRAIPVRAMPAKPGNRAAGEFGMSRDDGRVSDENESSPVTPCDDPTWQRALEGAMRRLATIVFMNLVIGGCTTELTS